MTEKALQHPITTLMIFLSILLLGGISLSKLRIALLPEIEFPEITVVTEYESASPSEVENLVTKPLEEALASVSGVRSLSSISSEGFSIIKTRFAWGKKMDYASMEIREKTDLVRGSLPQDTHRPIVLKYNPSDQPVMTFSLSSTYYDISRMRKIAEKEIIPVLERCDGVASVDLTGGLVREICIDVNMAQLASRNLGLQELIDAMENANYNYPAGSLDKDGREYMLRVMGAFENIEEMRDLVIVSGAKGEPIRLRDVAEIRDAYKDRTAISRYNGSEDLNLTIRKETLKNSVSVCRDLRKKAEYIRTKYAGHVNLEILQAEDTYILEANYDLFWSAIAGGIISFLIILLFLQNKKFSLIIILSIPLSAMVVFIAMFVRGFTINMISLGGIAIGIGMVVDNSNVVLESIERKLAENRERREAVIQGTREVSASVIGSTLTTLVVFLPIIFVKGIAGAVFGQLAFTISVAMLASLLISITLVPLLMVLPIPMKETISFFPKFPSWYGRMAEKYRGLLAKLIPIRRTVILCGPIVFLLGTALFFLVQKELFPPVDEGRFKIRLETPEGTSLEVTAARTKLVEDQLRKAGSRIKRIYSLTGYDERNIVLNRNERLKQNTSIIHVTLKEKALLRFKWVI